MTRRKVSVYLVMVLMASALSGTALGAQSRVLPLTAGEATFSANATFGDFSGRTTALRGEVQGGTEPWSVSGWVEVRLDSLRTGNGTRDGHMRGALETTTYPTASFTLDSLRPDPAVRAERGTGAQLFGQFTVHGVTRAVRVIGTIDAPADGVWRIMTSFPVTLAEYGITKGLSRAFGTIKVGPVVVVQVRAEFASR